MVGVPGQWESTMRYLTLAAAGLLAALSLAACDDVDEDAIAPVEPQQTPQQDPQTPPPTQ